MGSSKKRLCKRRTLETLLPNFESPEGIDQSSLKNLYRILVGLSSNDQWKVLCAEDSHEFNLEIFHEGIKLTWGDIRELSNVLFQKLEERFGRMFSDLSAVSAAKDLGESSTDMGLFNIVEILGLLFRCCMLLLPLVAAQGNLIFEKGPILLKIVRKLMLPNLMNTRKHAFVFEESVFREFAPQENGCSTSSVEGFSASLEFLEPCNPLRIFKCTMLEVLVDELLAHKQTIRSLKMIHSVTGTGDMLFTSRSDLVDAGILMEAICSHFFQSFSDKKAFGDFMSRLFSTHAMKLECPLRTPALSISAAVSLFLNPIMSSAPKYMQTHLISLVSEALHTKCMKPDRTLTNSFLATFEKSVILYMGHMSRLHTDGCSVLHWGSTSSSLHEFVPPLECYILPETKEKVDNLVSRLDSSSNEVFGGSFSRMKSDLVTTSLKFVKECISAYNISCEEQNLAILSYLVLKASESYNDESIQPIEGIIPEHLYLLASLLKLMSISLLQVIRCIRQSDDISSLRSLKDFSSCKEHGFILGMIACFKDLDISLPLQQDLYTRMSSLCTGNMDSKMMFLHFAGLMSLGFVTGLDFLVKACLLVNLALLNLFVFEEGNLDSLHSLVDSSGEYSPSGLPVVRFQERVSDRSSSLVVASRFHKLRSLHSSVVEYKHNEKESLSLQTLASPSRMEGAAYLEEETEETCSGEIFLKCVLQEDASGFDDLVDYVECKQGKDYSSYLKNRQRFRKWRSQKMAVLNFKRKKKSWKIHHAKRSS